jgi:hypothetical protein
MRFRLRQFQGDGETQKNQKNCPEINQSLMFQRLSARYAKK